MSRGPQTFRQRDITRALKAIAAAGATVVRIDVRPDGTISVVTADAPTTIPPSKATDGWDVL